MDIDFMDVEYKIDIEEYKYIGKGSGRVVYDLGNGYVVKVAINNKGFAQNKIEYNLSSYDESGIFAKIVSSSNNFKYIIMEKAEKIKNLIPVRNYFNVKNNKQLFQTKFIKEISSKYNLSTADLKRPSSWGLINGVPKIIDYGLTTKVYMNYYLKENLIVPIILLFLMRK